jgi:hypothetical protein
MLYNFNNQWPPKVYCDEIYFEKRKWIGAYGPHPFNTDSFIRHSNRFGFPFWGISRHHRKFYRQNEVDNLFSSHFCIESYLTKTFFCFNINRDPLLECTPIYCRKQLMLPVSLRIGVSVPSVKLRFKNSNKFRG